MACLAFVGVARAGRPLAAVRTVGFRGVSGSVLTLAVSVERLALSVVLQASVGWIFHRCPGLEMGVTPVLRLVSCARADGVQRVRREHPIVLVLAHLLPVVIA